MTHAILPWPPKELSPNARVHWAKKAKAAREYKSSCMWSLWYEKLPLPANPWAGKKSFKIEFSPPSERRADLDNMLAAIKPGIDALAHVTGVDDSEFQFTISKAPPVKGGAVRVEAI